MWTDIPMFENAMKITSRHFYVYLRDNLRFLYQPPMCRAAGTGNQDFRAGEAGLIDFQNAVHDNDGMHGGTPLVQNEPATGLITIQTAGKYMLHARADFDDSATGIQYIVLSVRLPPTTSWFDLCWRMTTYANSGGPHTVYAAEQAYVLAADTQACVRAVPTDDTAGKLVAEYGMPCHYVHWIGSSATT